MNVKQFQYSNTNQSHVLESDIDIFIACTRVLQSTLDSIAKPEFELEFHEQEMHEKKRETHKAIEGQSGQFDCTYRRVNFFSALIEISDAREVVHANE